MSAFFILYGALGVMLSILRHRIEIHLGTSLKEVPIILYFAALGLPPRLLLALPPFRPPELFNQTAVNEVHLLQFTLTSGEGLFLLIQNLEIGIESALDNTIAPISFAKLFKCEATLLA